MFDSNWTRWIVTSIQNHFDLRSSDNIKTYFEGDELSSIDNQKQYAEVRVDGPRYKEISKNYHKFEIDVGIMCSAHLSNDIHVLDKLVGLYQSKMTPIEVKKFGDRPGDDQSYIGCLILRDDVDPSVDTIPYGQTDAAKRMMQTSVEGFYKLELIF